MSLFQCDYCGCKENTALTNASSGTLRVLFKEKEYHDNCRKVLGLSDDEELGDYCSACTPIWFDESGNLGYGKNPNPRPGEGTWHGEFDRVFLPKGEFETAPNGNLRHKKTLDEDVEKFAIEQE